MKCTFWSNVIQPKNTKLKLQLPEFGSVLFLLSVASKLFTTFAQFRLKSLEKWRPIQPRWRNLRSCWHKQWRAIWRPSLVSVKDPYGHWIKKHHVMWRSCLKESFATNFPWSKLLGLGVLCMCVDMDLHWHVAKAGCSRLEFPFPTNRDVWKGGDRSCERLNGFAGTRARMSIPVVREGG